MTMYKATKNLVFKSLGKSVIVDELIDLDADYAAKVNKELKLTCPDVEAVLVPVDGADEAPKKPKRTKKKAEVETEGVEASAE